MTRGLGERAVSDSAAAAAEVSVRAFTPRDFDAIVARWHETNRLTYSYNAEHRRHTLADAETFFRHVVLETCVVLVAERGTRAAGVLALDSEWIRQLAVFPEFQRQGVGSALLAKAMERSPEELRLFTFARNVGARRFYEAHGFVPVRFGVSSAPECEPDVEYLWRGGEVD